MSMTETRLLYGAHVHANGIRQHYLRYGGKGSPLVLVPGITSPAITWGFVGDRSSTRPNSSNVALYRMPSSV